MMNPEERKNYKKFPCSMCNIMEDIFGYCKVCEDHPLPPAIIFLICALFFGLLFLIC